MKTCTEAERRYLDSLFQAFGSAGEEQTAVFDARLEVLKERLPPELIEQAIRLRADYHKVRARDSEMWSRFADLGFVGDNPGGKLWKQIDDAAKKLIGGDAAAPTRHEDFDDILRRP